MKTEHSFKHREFQLFPDKPDNKSGVAKDHGKNFRNELGPCRNHLSVVTTFFQKKKTVFFLKA